MTPAAQPAMHSHPEHEEGDSAEEAQGSGLPTPQASADLHLRDSRNKHLRWSRD